MVELLFLLYRSIKSPNSPNGYFGAVAAITDAIIEAGLLPPDVDYKSRLM